MNLKELVGIGLVTHNRLDLLKICLPSLLATGCDVRVFDNGSDRETVKWLSSQSVTLLEASPNRGLAYGRNRLIETQKVIAPDQKYIFQPDADVELLPGCLERMVELAESRSDIMFVAWPQANSRCAITEGLWVDEVANECLLSRMDVWDEIGLYPEKDASTGHRMMCYCSDTWKFRVANLHGYRVALVVGHGEGYRHYSHGAASSMSEVVKADAEVWERKRVRLETRLSDGLDAQVGYHPRESYSQYAEDRFIAEFFGSRKGRFLDIGAHDGAKDSNTLRLAELGWEGVAIEPNPVLFSRMLANHQRFDNRIRHVLGLLMPEQGLRTLHLNVDGLSTTHPEVFERLHRRVHFSGFCDCPTITPHQMLEMFGDRFEFVSIDVEGVDQDLVEHSANLLAKTELICVERAAPGTPEVRSYRERWCEILGRQGFKRLVYETAGNLLFARCD